MGTIEEHPLENHPLKVTESLEIAFTKALRAVFPALKSEDARAQFFALYQRESEEFDRDFLKKYDEDLNTSLIFAGLFSAVSSAFIIDVQGDLKPDYNKATATLLRILINKLDDATFSGIDLSTLDWSGPSPTVVNVQTLLYASLATSLLAAFLAMLGKQWLNRYHQVEKRGSLIDRSRHRQRKLDGMGRWGFSFVMEALPLMLQAGLLLLGCALSRYLWNINHTVATITIGVTSFGIVVYAIIVISATISYNCPFQTPASLILRSLITYDKCNRGYLTRARDFLSSTAGRVYSITITVKSYIPWKVQSISTRSQPEVVQKVGDDADQPGIKEGERAVEPMFNDKKIDWDGYASDGRCITWMLETSTDLDVNISAMRFIPEVEWHVNVTSVPSLTQLHSSVIECLDFTGTSPSLVLGKRNKIYATTKAFLHLFIQRSCINNEEVPLRVLRFTHKSFGSHFGPYDDDLKSVLWMMDHIIQGHKDILWSQPNFSQSHLSWLCHILVYQLWQSHQRDSHSDQLPAGLYKLLERALSCRSPPAQSVVTDCLLIIGLTIGVTCNFMDLWMVNKSSALTSVVERLYDGLDRVFRRPTSAQRIECALNALRVLTFWQKQSKADIEQHQRLSYGLCQAIMDSAIDQNTKWEATRLALQIGFRDKEFWGSCEDPTIALRFLKYHFDLEMHGEYHYESVADAFVALSRSADTYGAKFRIVKDSSLLHGMSSALKADKPIRLRRTALLFIEWVGNQLFEATAGTLMNSGQRVQFSSDIGTAVNLLADEKSSIEPSCLTILLLMARSKIWRPCMCADHWRALQRLSLRYTDASGVMQHCLNDRELLLSLKRANHWDAIGWWMKVVWTRFELLSPEIVDQVVYTTLELFGRKGKAAMDEFQALIDSEQNDIERVIRRTPSWETGVLGAMRARLDTTIYRRSTMQRICDSVGCTKTDDGKGTTVGPHSSEPGCTA